MVIKQFELGEDKIDFAAFKWKNLYELECLGIECKGTESNYEMINDLVDKVPRYSPWFPSLVMSIPAGSRNSAELRTLVHSAKWDLWEVDDNGVKPFQHEGIGWYRLDGPKFREVRTRGAILTIFKELFGDKIKEMKPRSAWTEGNPHYFAPYDAEAKMACFGVVILNSEKHPDLISQIRKIPPDYEVEFTYMIHLGSYKRVFQKKVADLTEHDIEFLKNPVHERETTNRVNIKKTLWTSDDFLDRDSHFEVMSQARDELEDHFKIMGSTGQSGKALDFSLISDDKKQSSPAQAKPTKFW